MQRQLSTILLCLLLLPFDSTAATLKEKIGQMVMVGFKGAEISPNDPIAKAILIDEIGGVILFDYDFQTKTFDHNIKIPAQLKTLTQTLQAYAKKAALIHHHAFTPLLIGIDYEGGSVNRLKEKYGFPKTESAGTLGQGSLEDAKHDAEQMAKTLSSEGINLNFAPVLDVNINPDNPVIGKLNRSFSNDPKKVTQYAAIFSKAYQDHGILCAYKHFPGHGSSLDDTHAGFVDVTKTWQSKELDPYQKLLQKSYHCPIVMTAHVVNNALDKKEYPASISYAMTQKLLRDKLNFKEVVVTDDMQMKAITDHYGFEDA